MSEIKPPTQKSESDATVEMNKPIVQMTAPAPDGAKMLAPGAKVKIKAIRPINISTDPTAQKILTEGEVAEVTPAQAAEFCDKKFRGNYAYSGERYEDKQPAVIVRAVRV